MKRSVSVQSRRLAISAGLILVVTLALWLAFEHNRKSTSAHGYPTNSKLQNSLANSPESVATDGAKAGIDPNTKISTAETADAPSSSALPSDVETTAESLIQSGPESSFARAMFEARHAVVDLTKWESELEQNAGVRSFADNPRNHISARFLDNGVRFESGKPNDTPWSLKIALQSGANSKGSPVISGNRVEYKRGQITEWFVNKEEGFEHGYTIQSPLTGNAGSGRLEIEASLTGLRAEADPSNESDLQFKTFAGKTVMNYKGLKVTDSSGRELVASMSPTYTGIRFIIEAVDAEYPVTIDPLLTGANDEGNLANAVPDAVDYSFGRVVALSGNTAVVGAPDADTPAGYNAGNAYCFVRNNTGEWTFQQKLDAGMSAGSYDYFGSSVSIDSDTIVVGAPDEDIPYGLSQNGDEGAAYIFTRSGSTWSYSRRIDNGGGPYVTGNGYTYYPGGDSILGSADVASARTQAIYLQSEIGPARSISTIRLQVSHSDGNVRRNFKIRMKHTSKSNFNGSLAWESGFTTVYSGNVTPPDSGPWILNITSFPYNGSDNLMVDFSCNNWGGSPVGVQGSLSGRLVTDENRAVGTGYLTSNNGTNVDPVGWSGTSPFAPRANHVVPSLWINPDPYANFGQSVAVDGDRIAVGAPGDESSAGTTGTVVLFLRNGSNWQQDDRLIPSSGKNGGQFGSNLDIDGNTVIVGAPYEDTSDGASAGAAYVYTRGASWTQQARLVAQLPGGVGSGSADDYFGEAVAIHGDQVIVGAPGEDEVDSVEWWETDYGAAYVYARSGTTWTPQAKLVAQLPDGSNSRADSDNFGQSVALSTDLAIVGASGTDALGITDTGAAYVFGRDDGTWKPEVRLVNANGYYYENFGSTVALDRDLALVGESSGGSVHPFLLKTPYELLHSYATGPPLSSGTPNGDLPLVKLPLGIGMVPLGGSRVAVGKNGLDQFVNAAGSVISDPAVAVLNLGVGRILAAKEISETIQVAVFQDDDNDGNLDPGEAVLSNELVAVKPFNPVDDAMTVPIGIPLAAPVPPELAPSAQIVATEVLHLDTLLNQYKTLDGAANSPLTLTKDGSGQYTAIRPDLPGTGIRVPWRLQGAGGVLWPYQNLTYQVEFDPGPTPIVFVRDSTSENGGAGMVIPTTGVGVSVVYAAELNTDTVLTETTNYNITNGQFTANVPGRFVLLFDPTPDSPQSGDEYYQTVMAYEHDTSGPQEPVNVEIGKEIMPVAGTVYGTVHSGSRHLVHVPDAENSLVYGQARANWRQSQIISVNTDQFEIWWHREWTIPNTGGLTLDYPSAVGRYKSVWRAQDYFTKKFDGACDVQNRSFLFTPTEEGASYSVVQSGASAFPTDPTGGEVLHLTNNSQRELQLQPGHESKLFTTSYDRLYVNSNGYVTFGEGSSVPPTINSHFDLPAVSPFAVNLDPGSGGTVSWKELSDRAVITFESVPQSDGQDTVDYFTEKFSGPNDIVSHKFTFNPTVPGGSYVVTQEEATALPTDPTGGVNLVLADNDYARADLGSGNAVSFFGNSYSSVYVGSNGSLTFGQGSDLLPSLAAHFSLPTLSGLGVDLDPTAGGVVSWKDLSDRAVVTFQGVPGSDGLAGGYWTGDDFFTEHFAGDFDLRNKRFVFKPNSRGNTYLVTQSEVSGLPNNPSGSILLGLTDDDFTEINLSTGRTIRLFGVEYDTLYVGSNGQVTFGQGSSAVPDLASHFSLPTVSAFGTDLDPSAGGTASWKEMVDRAIVTFQNVPGKPEIDNYTEQFSGNLDIINKTFTFTPLAEGSGYTVAQSEATTFPTDPNGGTYLYLGDEDYVEVPLTQERTVKLFGETYGSLFVGSNGFVSFGQGSSAAPYSYSSHFELPQISGFGSDLNPSWASAVTIKDLSDRAVVTFEDVPTWYDSESLHTFQMEMFHDGRITITILRADSPYGIVGLSPGGGIPAGFVPTDFSNYGLPPMVPLNTFQMELFYDGAIALTVVRADSASAIVGLSNGLGLPPNFSETDFTNYRPDSFALPPDATLHTFQMELFHDGTLTLTVLRADTNDSLVGLSNGEGLPDAFSNTDFTKYRDPSVPLPESEVQNNFQMELYYDGRIGITVLKADSQDAIIGLSEGLGLPSDFMNSDYSEYYNSDNPPPPDPLNKDIVIAGQHGTSEIPPATFKNFGIYFQNDSSQTGFNPNDEHALVAPALGSQSGSAIFALRNDLGRPTTSDPHVLMYYREPGDTEQAKIFRMRSFPVLAEDPTRGLTFNYTGEAGKLIQPFYPLPLLRPSAPNNKGDGVSGPYLEDRKGDLWAKAAGDDGASAQIMLDWYYLNQTGFYFPPGAHIYGVTDSVPFLDNDSLNPRNVAYTVTWPALTQELRMGETLVKPKNGLPAIQGNDSVQVIYEQGRGLAETGMIDNVKLIDYQAERKVKLSDFGGLASLPSDVSQAQDGPIVKFGNLPPTLAKRLYYDPIQNELRFKGEFMEPAIGQPWVLLNVITPAERAVLLNPSFRGGDSRFNLALTALCDQAAAVKEIPKGDYIQDPATKLIFDSMAVTAGYADGEGYVTLAMNNDPDFSSPAAPVSLEIIKVKAPLYRGTLQVISPESLFDEKLSLIFDGDQAGLSDQYEFQWKTVPASQIPSPQADESLPGGTGNVPWLDYTIGTGRNSATIEGAGLQTLSDNYFTCRYRPLNPAHPLYNGGQGWSLWTPAQLAEGWIKRVLGQLNPFEQRFSDLSNPTRSIDTTVSMVSLAGPRWEGNIPLTQTGAINSGLLEAYETILKRGIGFSIEGLPAIDYPDANNALLLAASRIANMYLLLGNEAYADASDPTIAIGASYQGSTSSIHCFQNIVGGSTLLEEELSLLRGRDDLVAPGVRNRPVYNRLLWNFSQADGEVAYKNNYGIRDNNHNGSIDENDAKIDYPQGHGDAWGHYLSAVSNYYRLLRNPQFTWQKRSEQILLGDVPVEVDYLDERLFAKAAAARAQAGSETVSLTYRDRYKEDPNQQWRGYKDTQTYSDGSKRAWGVDDWGVRTGQGAYLDWAIGNALLPADDSPHTGIQKIDRTTVTELRDLASSLTKVQTEVDKADSGLNPLGLVKGVLPMYELTSADVDAGSTLFEKAYGRSVTVLNNALAVFNRADGASQQLREQSDSLANFQDTVNEREMDLRNRLIEVFGYPYSNDIGGGGTYPLGYSGPDIYHYMLADPSELTGVDQRNLTAETVTLRLMDYGLEQASTSDRIDSNGVASPVEKQVTYYLSTQGYGFIKPTSWTGSRQAQGQLQVAHSEVLQARSRLDRAILEYDNHLKGIDDRLELLEAQKGMNASEILVQNSALGTQIRLSDAILVSRKRQTAFRTIGRIASLMSNSVAEGVPSNIIVIGGMAVGGGGDFGAPARSAIRTIGTLVDQAMSVAADAEGLTELGHQQAKETVQSQTSITLSTLRDDFAILQEVKQIETMMRQEASLRLEVYTSKEVMIQAAERYKSLLAQGQRLLEERLLFRQKTAANVQTMRYKDMAFRIFRNDALEKFRAQFDVAASWVYMAARAYDYETNWAGDGSEPAGVRPGREFLESIVKARTIGEISNGQPITSQNSGDGGLADSMARMKQNWDNLKGPLGYNQPQHETIKFSLRKELLRVPAATKNDSDWREALQRYVVADIRQIPEFMRYCIPPSGSSVEPAIVIPFSTQVEDGINFFGWPLAGGDNSYSSTVSATKIQKTGVWFSNYNNSSLGLINTPRVYLVPVGADIMRSPRVTSTREWRVAEQVIPTPFALSQSYVNNLPGAWVPQLDVNSFIGNEADIRRFADFRAYHDAGAFDASQLTTNTRLIGRSVWNTRWLLIIRGRSLLSNPDEGIQRFINGALVSGQRDGQGIKDVLINFQTYAIQGY